MKDVVDLKAIHNKRCEESLPEYQSAMIHNMATNFIFECGIRLHLLPDTIATAAMFYHNFFKKAKEDDYDCHVISLACLCAAAKSRYETFRFTDAIYIAINSLHRGALPMKFREDYWSLQGTLIKAELLVLRQLNFELDTVSAHRYLLHYLRSLQEWFAESQQSTSKIARTAMAFLQDFHHSSSIADYRAPHVAVACLTLALLVFGVPPPLASTHGDDVAWYSVFTKDLQKDKIWEIMDKIMQVYITHPSKKSYI
ncbi:cyclin-Q-like [Battus philenor]|uniref:cyclin-Q-like n=1 Tax=Battus philenor TaxID=42288 RepID=UPI0035CEA1B9